MYDVYCVANSEEEANAAALSLVRAAEDPLVPNEQVANECRKAKEIRQKYETERPLVGADVSDEDFETLKGKTNAEIHAMLYAKAEPEPAAAK